MKRSRYLITVLLGYLIWRLVVAALYTERKVSGGSEDVDPSMVPAASRLNTLIPLFRNFLLGFLAIIIIMIVLSSVGDFPLPITAEFTRP